MTFKYPLKIAHSLLGVISSLPSMSIEVHGMGIFEKIFEIGNSMIDVVQASGSQIPHEIYGICQDPFEMFVRTLSQTPNSQKQYASLLLAKVAEKPEIQRFSQILSPALSVSPMEGKPLPPTEGPARANPWSGSVMGEIEDTGQTMYKVEEEENGDGREAWGYNNAWNPEIDT